MEILTLKQYHRMLRRLHKPTVVKWYRKLSAEKEAEIIRLRLEGAKLQWIALEFGVTTTTIFKIVKNLPKRKKNSAILPNQNGELNGAT